MFNKPIKYFGLNDTYNVFTKEYVPLVIENRKYTIPNNVNIQGEEWVSINIGYIQLQSTLPTEYQLEILDTNGSSVLQTLTLKEGVIGVDIKPTETECIWFNENGIRGNYYIHSKWLGKIFHIKRGLYIGTAVGADYFNNIYERNNIIFDSKEHYAGYYFNGKPVYYVAQSGSYPTGYIYYSNDIDTLVDYYLFYSRNSNLWELGVATAGTYNGYRELFYKMALDSQGISFIIKMLQGDNLVTFNALNPVFWFTKKSDNRSL